MKKLLALLFVCAGLTAMAVNPVHTSRTQIGTMKKGAMLLKDNKLSKDLTLQMNKAPQMKVGQKGSLTEFIKTHDMSQNRLMKRAPRRATYTDVATDWVYSSVECPIVNGTPTPTWYAFTGMTFKIDTILEEEGYCELYLGVMPFMTDPDGSGTQYSAGHYTIFPDCYAYYVPETNEFGLFSDFFYKYPLSANRQNSGTSNYRITARFWYTGIGNEAMILGTGERANIEGTCDMETGMITFEENFGPIEAQVYKTFTISRTNYNKVLNMLAAGADVYDVAWALASYPGVMQANGITYTSTTSDSTFYSNALYQENTFILPNATHTYDKAYKAESTDTVFVDMTYTDPETGETTSYKEFVRDSVIHESTPVFVYQKTELDSIFAWNLYNLSNVPDVYFTLDANGTVVYPWQPIYWEDMSVPAAQYGLDFTNYFFNYYCSFESYNQGGVEGLYETDFSWDDTPCRLNETLNEITWDGTEIYNVYQTDDNYLHLAFGFYQAYANNKLTLDYALTLPQPAETWQLGDVNHDGDVDVADVALMIKVALGQDYDVFYWEEANLDDDPDNVDIGDVSALINIVLGKE